MKGCLLCVRLFCFMFAAILLLSGCDGNWLFEDTPTEIESGFSDRLLSMLEDRYDLRIPKDARFVGGYFTNAFRDPEVVVAFDLPIADPGEDDDWDFQVEQVILSLFKQKEVYCREKSGAFNRIEMGERFGRTYIGAFESTGDPFTGLLYSAPVDGVISFCFIGHHPGDSFS